MSDWRLLEHVATVQDLHDIVPGGGTGLAGPELWWCRPTDRAMVVGRSQHVAVRAHGAGLAVATRRSGGAAVVVVPGDVLWLDAVIPISFAPWVADIRGSMAWFGGCWQQALAACGVEGTVHSGGLQRTRLSAAVCFAGVGPGEVLDQRGAKLVGLAQRRTSRWIRVQAMCHHRWDPTWYAGVVGASDVAALADIAGEVPTDPAVLVGELCAAVARNA